MRRGTRRAARAVACAVFVLALVVFHTAAAEATTVWTIGDVFAGIASGSYSVFSNSGAFKETISNGSGGFTTGCAFNPGQTKLYTTSFSSGVITVYDNAEPHSILQTIDPPSAPAPENVVFAASGKFYNGGPGSAAIDEFDTSGAFVATHTVAGADGTGGTDWMDLAKDEATMFYDAEGRTIKRFNVATNTQLADFATLPGEGEAFALRLLPPGDGSGGLIVADGDNVKRLDGSGAVVQTYDVTGNDNWFAMNLDPNGTSIWAGDFGTNNFYRFNIATGAVEIGPIASGGNLFGLCLKGEPTAGGGVGGGGEEGGLVCTHPTGGKNEYVLQEGDSVKHGAIIHCTFTEPATWSANLFKLKSRNGRDTMILKAKEIGEGGFIRADGATTSDQLDLNVV